MKHICLETSRKSVSFITCLLKRLPSSYFHLQKTIINSTLPRMFFSKWALKSLLQGKIPSHKLSHQTFCRSDCIYYVYSHKLRVLISHFFVEEFFPNLNTNPDYKVQREMASWFLKPVKNWAKAVCRYIIRKKKKNYTAWKSEIMSLLVDFSLKKLILSKKTQTNKKHTKTPKTTAFIFTEVIYCFSS